MNPQDAHKMAHHKTAHHKLAGPKTTDNEQCPLAG
jgi:hypothetical protein